MEAKPICVIKVDFDGIQPKMEYREISDLFAKKLNDYHVFVVPITDYSEPHDLFEFQVFYEKDHQPISYDELKELLLQSIKSE